MIFLSEVTKHSFNLFQASGSISPHWSDISIEKYGKEYNDCFIGVDTVDCIAELIRANLCAVCAIRLHDILSRIRSELKPNSTIRQTYRSLIEENLIDDKTGQDCPYIAVLSIILYRLPFTDVKENWIKDELKVVFTAFELISINQLLTCKNTSNKVTLQLFKLMRRKLPIDLKENNGKENTLAQSYRQSYIIKNLDDIDEKWMVYFVLQIN